MLNVIFRELKNSFPVNKIQYPQFTNNFLLKTIKINEIPNTLYKI